MSELRWDEIDRRAVDTARVLAADAVEKVGNGHPGTAMSLAPAAYLLYQRVLRHDPADVHWLGRDRFILSAGHSSLTQYVQLYLGGFGLELDDLKALRTWGSLTPGHPEYGHTKGVEITTGPLGQGLASAVGFAYAARYERGLFDPEAAGGHEPVRPLRLRDRRRRRPAGGRDLRGVARSPATRQLGNLIAIYDSNQISIEDDTNVAFTEDVAKRYESYGWHVQTVDWKKTGEYVEDVAELYAAIEAAKGETVEAVAHHPEDDHRLALARQAEHRQDPRLRARRRRARGDEEGARLRPRADLRRRRRRARAHARARRARRRGARRVAGVASTRGPRRTPSARRCSDRLEARRAARGHRRRAAGVRGRQGRLDPRRIRHGHQRPRRRAARAVGRLGRPRRVEPHHDQGREVVHPRAEWSTHEWSRRPVRPRAALRHPRARDGRDRQRHRAARPDPRRSAARS